ncbi:MAG: co-chaperone DjlA [Gammaproteobacteria bacterium]
MDLFTWIVRLLGALIGLVLLVVIVLGSIGFGVMILVAGLLLALFAGRGRGPWRMVMRDASGARQTFFETAFTLMGSVAKCDGRISEPEIALTEQLIARMGLSADQRKEAIGFFKRGADPAFDIETQLRDFSVHCGMHANLRQMLMVFLFSTAAADGAVSGEEHALLKRVALRVGFSEPQFEQMLRMFAAQEHFSGARGAGARPDALAEAYAALGMTANASDRELKQAYRRLMSQYHPDKLIAEGVPEEMIRLATERTQEIQAAWEIVCKARGI